MLDLHIVFGMRHSGARTHTQPANVPETPPLLYESPCGIIFVCIVRSVFKYEDKPFTFTHFGFYSFTLTLRAMCSPIFFGSVSYCAGLRLRFIFEIYAMSAAEVIQYKMHRNVADLSISFTAQKSYHTRRSSLQQLITFRDNHLVFNQVGNFNRRSQLN